VLLGWGIATIARNIFNNDPKTTTESLEGEVESVSTVDLSDIDTSNTTVKLTIEGAVVASNDQRSMTIEVGRNKVEMKVFKDYGQTVLREASYPNNIEAYESFLKALEASRFTKVREGADASNDDARGKCADGRRYIIETKSLDESIMKLWGTSCSKTQGTAGGNLVKIRALFKKQVPDYLELSKDITLY
jgi:hypothetical protein